MKKRTALVRRRTSETDITVALNLDGTGKHKVSTGLPFLDHMLDLMARHSMMDLTVKAQGDLAVDYHHTVEDLGLALGDAMDVALGNRKGIGRYGWSLLPMDEALSQVAVDLGGRPFLVMKIACRKKKILDFDLGLLEEFFRALTVEARMNLHIDQSRGKEPHHAYEAIFKAFARALRMALSRDARCRGVPSTKGRL
jgi:imidazoleglycerol-phosphate dehydratase